MKKIILLPIIFALVGCSNQDLGKFGVFVFLMIGGPYFFMMFTSKVREHWNDSFLARILFDDGALGFFINWLLLFGWLVLVSDIID